MKLFTSAPCGATLVQNTFIDHYMPHANGEYVKVYLYLLRCAQTNAELTLSSVADALEYTEKDLLRALAYWEKAGLLQMSCAPDGTIQDIIFNDLSVPPAETEKRDKILSMVPSRSRMDALRENPDIQQLIFVAEQYLQRPLSSSEQEDLFYYYDSLGFSADLIEYLLEYCISKGSPSRHYMRKVALAWADAGVTTVAQAREETNLYNKNYFTIMNAFGIKGRNPAAPELETMSHWINELGYSLDIILEACRRTICQTHQPNFQYANTILEKWKKQGVRCSADIIGLDKKRKAGQKEKEKGKEKEKPQPAARAANNNRFNNFSQREYDYSQLERRLLNS